jgi:hypothetical protein
MGTQSRVMKTERPYSMTHIGGRWCAIVKWDGKRYEVIRYYEKKKHEERIARIECVKLNDDHER